LAQAIASVGRARGALLSSLGDCMTADEQARRQFWTEQMEQSFSLLQAMSEYQLNECGEPMESIRHAAEEAGIEMLFSDSKIAGELDRIFAIRANLIPDLLAIARDMRRRGWVLRIEDGFRTREMQTRLGRMPAVFDMIVRMCWWENGDQPPSLDLITRRSTCLVANYLNRGTHTMGAAVDISVFRLEDGSEIDRGRPYLDMSECTPMTSPFVGDQQQQNRRKITELMEGHGFMHYPGEFWHYNKGDPLFNLMTRTGQPAQYGPVHWDPRTNLVTLYDDITSPLTPPDLMEENLHRALERLNLSPSGAKA